ncbi:tRNA-dihydrouridine synthase [Halococcus thailandensis]|uniref:Dihydropyrimidine dehydrogenase n=1 Tax=Halococcus thailandensis JCM 13552 TaxID=1227457 RepID=M0MXP5_9EURY|nr:tRNA-dihydrouridine synthase [Halococcus thailandensis]EMA50376.1 dihydropyrimidine dehydrogenase [Halococcus thailandensis JCM 13552]
MFEPRLALASLSGESDAAWARSAETHADAAFLGGIAIDEPSRRAARRMAKRDRDEFLPDDPLAFVEHELDALDDAPLRAGVNVRSGSRAPIHEVAELCREHDAMLELNAHCRQDELCAVGCGETLLRDAHRLCEQVETAADTGATVSVKVRAEVPGVSLPDTARWIDGAGADVIHVDAMDSESVIRDVADAAELFVVANNGVRDGETAREYLEYGADAVSVGRPSDRPAILRRVREAVDDWFETETEPTAGAGR